MWQRTRAVRQTLPSLKSIADDIYCRRSPAERIAQRPGARSRSQLLHRLFLISGLSCKTTFNKELCTSNVPLYSMKPNFRNLFMKKLTRDRVVPIISASISWLNFPTIGSGLPSLPKFAAKGEVGRDAFRSN